MMERSIARLAIIGAMSVGGVLLALAVAYRVRGSLEWFPTAEQEAKARQVTTLLVAGFAAAEVGLWQLLRWANRAVARQEVPDDGARPSPNDR